MCRSDCLRKEPGISRPTSRIGRLLNRYSFSFSHSVRPGPASVSRSLTALHMPSATISRSKRTTPPSGIRCRSAGSRRVIVSMHSNERRPICITTREVVPSCPCAPLTGSCSTRPRSHFGSWAGSASSWAVLSRGRAISTETVYFMAELRVPG
ncbi:hypothetical protein SF23_12905 [Streptomyces sp. MBRL 10]|nr:hypothetical protein SF23_12905 [Streptomyces sp. MBRL 10]